MNQTKFTSFFVIVIGFFGAVVLGRLVGTGDFAAVSEIIILLLIVAWLVKAGLMWWLPMPFAFGLGGYSSVSLVNSAVKIYPHEVALMVCTFTLIPQLILRRNALIQRRQPLPFFFKILAWYLVLHLIGSLFYNRIVGLGGAGNTLRAYMNALWPILFGVLYQRYGATEHCRKFLLALYVGYFIRLIFGFYDVFTGDETHSVPWVNYTLDPQDLRASGLAMFILSFLYLFSTEGFWAKVWHPIMIVVSGYGLLLGGSRGLSVIAVFFVLVLFFLLKKWTLLTIGSVAATVFIVLVNLEPALLENLPYRVQRGLSVFVLQAKQLDVQEDSEGSNLWHQELPREAYHRWTDNMSTLAFGTGIRPYDPAAQQQTGGADYLYTQIKYSADVGAYESGFWTVLAVTGSVGISLYLFVLLYYLWALFPVVWRHGMKNPIYAIAAWSSCGIVSWLVFCVVAGTYPSFELFLAVVAKAALDDLRDKEGAKNGMRAAIPSFQRPLAYALPVGR